MLKIGLVLIGIIMLFVAVYTLRAFRKMNVGTESKLNNMENIVNQIEKWEETYELSSNSLSQKEDLFSPSKMKNGNINTDELQIEVKDYTSQVPWFFRI